MFNIATNFFDLIGFIIPGFVILYSFRRIAPNLNAIFIAINKNQGLGSVIALFVLAAAMGVIASALSSLFIPRLMRTKICLLGNSKPNYTKPDVKSINFAKLYQAPEQAVKMFLHHVGVYRMYANMAVAMFISAIIFVWRIDFLHRPSSHAVFKLLFLLAFFLGSLLASINYLEIVYSIAYSLTESEPSVE